MLGLRDDDLDFALGAAAVVEDIPAHPTYSDPVAWIQREFYIPELRHHDPPAMQLDAYQSAVLREAYRTDADGKFVYDVVLWGDIKKSIKSCIAAAVMLHRALETPWGSFKVVANDLQQADSRVFYYIRRALELNKTLGARATIRNYKISLDNHAVIQAIPVDPKGEAGGNDDLIEWTELHAANGKAAESMWSEMTLSPTKHGYSQRWIDTYAGHQGEAPTLEQLYETGVKQGRRLTLVGAPDDLEVYANGKLLVLWNTRPRLPWQSEAYYASEATTLTDSEFRRMHRNEWSLGSHPFVPIEWWDACAGTLSPMRGRQAMIVALDAAVSNDCFGIVAVTRTGDTVEVRHARRWIPPQRSKLDYANPNDRGDSEYPEGYLRWLMATYNVVCVVYDEYQLHDFCTRLSGEGLGWFEPFPQGAQRLVADKQLHDLIRERAVVHDGDADLREHIQNANRTDEDADKLRIVKRASSLKIDLAVSLSMSAYQAKYLSIG